MTIQSILANMFPHAGEEPMGMAGPSSARQFVSSKSLCEKDAILVDMLNSKGHEDVCYCVCDPDQKDLPIIFSSDGFCKYTGYPKEEIEGRNCRFLQGPDTAQKDIDQIRDAIKGEKPTAVNLLNYRKDGSTFVNQFFISPLYDEDKKLAFFVGVQCEVDKLGPGQAPANPAWVYSEGLHA